MSAKLSNNQKRHLSELSRRAWHKAGPELDGLSEEEFRHQEVAKASGKIGLRCCDQNDYKLVESHFLDLLGQHGAAFSAKLRATTETRRLVEHKILKACEEFGFRLSYADAICRAQNHGRGLNDVEEKTLWRIFYTIRNRGLSRKNPDRRPPTRPVPKPAPQFQLN